MSGYEPRVLGLMCHWCSYAAADRAGQGKLPLPASFLPVRVMCTGRVSPEQIARALGTGADGVMVLGCHPQDCHYRNGNLRARATIQLTRRLLEGLGVEPERLRLEWISASESQRLVQVVWEYVEILRELGPFQPVAPLPFPQATVAKERT